MKSYLQASLLLIFICLFHSLSAQTEIEPNGTPQSATPVLEDSIMTGVLINTSTDEDIDGYVTYPGTDGILVLTYTYSGGSTGTDFSTRIYGASESSFPFFTGNGFLGNKQITNTAATTDSLVLHCLAQDTVYFWFKFFQPVSATINYQFSYRMIPSASASDTELNNLIEDATEFLPTDTMKGRIGYVNAFYDDNDYFFSVIPENGQLRYYVNYENHSDPTLPTNADFKSNLIRRNPDGTGQNTFAASEITSTPLGPGKDSIAVDCVRGEGDTVFFRIAPGNAQGCFSYSFHYDIIPPEVPNDIEPNDEREEAVQINLTDTLTGQIGYTGWEWDQYDHFRYFGDSSEVQIWLEVENLSGDTNAEINVRTLRDITPNLVQDDVRIKNLPLGKMDTTWTTKCLEADSLTLEVKALKNGCLSYRVFMEKISCDATSIDERVSTLKIYPNPAKDYLVVEGFPKDAQFRFRNVVGQEIQLQKSYESSNHMQFLIPEHLSGILLLEIESQKGKVFQKILCQ